MSQSSYAEAPVTGTRIGRRMAFFVVWAAIVLVLLSALASRLVNGATFDLATTGVLNNVQADVIAAAETAAASDAPIIAASNALISPIFSPEVQHWAPLIIDIATDFDLDPDIVATVMQIESCGYEDAESHAGAQGLFQVMPFHFGANEIMKDPYTNAYRGAKYLAEGLAMTAGDVNLTLAGYNGGHGTAQKAMAYWPNEMQRYYYWGSGIYADAKAGKAYSERLDEWMLAGGAGLCNQAAMRIGLLP